MANMIAFPNSSEVGWQILTDFSLPSAPGNEREAMCRVAEAVQGLSLSPQRLEQLKTAVAEATLNAMEHGNQYRPDLPVRIRVLASEAQRAVTVQVTDQARAGGGPVQVLAAPDLDAKLAGRQSPRGWGFFLIKKMVDDVRVTGNYTYHTIELFLYLDGERPGRAGAK